MGKRRVLLAGMVVVAGATGVGGAVIANGRGERLRAELAGTNEVPPTDLDARGRARVELDVAGGELCFSVRFDGTGTPNRGHIHVGVAGVNGGIVVPLFELRELPTDVRNDALERRRLEDCVPADRTVLEQIAADPTGYYVNLHNSRFPAGNARGQLE